VNEREVARHWDANAPDWIRAVRAGYDVYREYVNNPVFFEMLGDIRGLRILDLGCGEGRNTRLFADRGAKVVAIDLSEAMIAAAREEEAREPRGIEYHLGSASDLSRFADGSFDAVLSTMAIMDLPDYGGCVREVARVLKTGGPFQFSITHPCVQTRLWKWVIDDQGRRLGVVVGNYFSLQPPTPEQDVGQWFFGAAPPEVKATARPFRIPYFFRTLSEYFNTLVAAGFTVERLAEPYANEEGLARHPALDDTLSVPYFLVFRCRRA
jgi:ubiquinone/menaquinone biosynthesis C-methylase UbiE